MPPGTLVVMVMEVVVMSSEQAEWCRWNAAKWTGRHPRLLAAIEARDAAQQAERDFAPPFVEDPVEWASATIAEIARLKQAVEAAAGAVRTVSRELDAEYVARTGCGDLPTR